MARILCTGHQGFIGKHLFRELLKDEFNEVVGIDLKDNRDIRELEPEDFEKIDYVFHLAAQTKVQQSIEKPLFTNEHNITGTLNVLWCAKEAGVKKVIYSASSSAYGYQQFLPLREGMKPRPMSPYGIQKLVGEQYANNFAHLYKLETVSLRYFNVYGNEMDQDSPYGACIAKFIKQKKEGKPLTILGGKQTRDFTYVGDVVRANILAMKSDVGRGEVINIGSGINYSIEQIALAISDNVEYLPQRKGEPQDTQADITRAKKLLGWEPTVDVIEWLTNLNESSSGA